MATTDNHPIRTPNPLDPSDETLRPLASYTDRLPSSRSGKKLSREALWRWAHRGSAGHVLETVSVGGGRCTSDKLVCEFLAAVTKARTMLSSRDEGAPHRRSPTPQRRKGRSVGSARAEAYLLAEGVIPGGAA